MIEGLPFKYRVTLRSEARDTPLAEYFDDGEVILSSVQLHDELLDEVTEDEILFASENSEPSDYELDEVYEILMGWSFEPIISDDKPLDSSIAALNEAAGTESPKDVELPKLTSPTADDEMVISLLDCEDYEAAFILVNGETVFSGNYWDFHSGCIGSVIAGEELDGLWDSGMESLVTALKLRFMEKKLRVVTETIAITELQYELI